MLNASAKGIYNIDNDNDKEEIFNMKNKKMSRLFSIILCLGVVASLLPSGNALAAGDESVVFNFGYVQNNAAGDTDIAADVSDIKKITEYGNNGARKWRYLESSGVRDNGESYYDNNYTCIRTNTGGWAAFELTGLSGGEYSANVTYTAVAAPIATAELYILPAEAVSGSSIANYLASGKLPFGTVKCESGGSAGFEKVQLAPSESGKYILVVSTPAQGGRVAINNITFTRTGEYVAPAVEVTLKFGYNQNISDGDTDITASKTVTDIADYGDKGARKWKYWDSKNLRSDESYYYGNYTQIRTNSGGWIAFELTGLASAEYKMTVNHTAYSAAPIAHAYLYIFPVEELGAGTVEDYLASGRAVKAGSLDGSKTEERTFEGVQLAPSASNTYVLVASTSVKAGTFKLTDITFTPTGEYKETGAASQSPFGELAAYIEKKNDASYTINVLSAIKSLDYKKIGFKIMLDGEAENSPAAFVEINTLYNQVNAPDFGGEPLTAAWFFEGGSQDGYVFIGERELASADAEGKKLIFCPYALKNDDTAVWGNEFTVTVGGGN